MIYTNDGTPLIPTDRKLLWNYLTSLINMFYKILPLWEDGERSLGVYMKSLQLELTGCSEFIDMVDDNASVVSLMSILQFLIDHPETDVATVKREVFHSISICKRLRQSYATSDTEVE